MREQDMPESWHRDGNTIYTLKHYGWRKGVEQFCNATVISVSGDDAESKADDIYAMFTADRATPAPHDAGAVEAFENIYDVLGLEACLAIHDDAKRVRAALAKSDRAPEAVGRNDWKDQAYLLFYRDGKTLGDIAQELGKSLYALTPWLTAPLMHGIVQPAALSIADVEAISKILEFYADKKNYDCERPGYWTCTNPATGSYAFEADEGQRAKKAMNIITEMRKRGCRE